MPIYLAHGFRWPRDGFTGIRVHAIVNDLEDVSVEYVQNAHSRSSLLTSFRTKYPEIMQELERPGRAVDFIEQYDPEDEGPSATSQPWAFVCDRVVMIAGGENAAYYAGKLLHGGGMRASAGKPRKQTLPMTVALPFNSPANISALSVNIEDVTADGPGMSTEAWQAFADLRDKIAEGEKIGWWVVYNGDPDRAYDHDEEDEEEEEEAEEREVEQEATPVASPSRESAKSPTGGRMPPPVPPSSSPKAQRSSAQSILSSSTSGTTTSKERRVSDPTGSAPEVSKSKSGSKSQGLKKLFGKRS